MRKGIFHTIGFCCAWLLLFVGCQPPGTGGVPQIPGVDSQTVQNMMGMMGDAALEFQELAKPSKVRAWVDNLIVKSQPGKDMPELARMKEGEEATYLYQRTIRKSEFSLRGQEYNESWLLIRTKDSVMGWVHGGGVVFVQPDFTKLFTQGEGQPAAVPAGDVQTRSLDELSPGTSPKPQPTPEQLRELEKIDFRVVPGKRVGPIHVATSEDELVAMYGPGVTRGTVDAPPAKLESCTILMGGTSDELRITWKDESRTQVKAIYFSDPRGKWHTKEGVKVGISMLDLTKINKSPVSFYGFDWDYSGTVSDYGKGVLASQSKLFYLRLAPQYLSLTHNLVKPFKGDKVFNSNTDGIDKLSLVVDRMVVYLD